MIRLKINRGKNKIKKNIGSGILKTLGGLKKALSIKKIISLFILITGSSLSLFSCLYLATDEDNGETGSYIDNNNKMSHSVDKDNGEVGYGVEQYSPANAACMAYYELVARDSLWQEYINDKGELDYIPMSDERAKHDYFNRDKDFYVHPDLLYCMNDYIFGNYFVCPEIFARPIAYDKENFTVIELTDDEGNVVVSSTDMDEDGKVLDTISKSVSNYGLGSVCRYTAISKSTYLKGNYVMQDVVSPTGEIVQEEIVEPYNIPIESESLDVLDKVITFSGVIEYKYSPMTIKKEDVKEGESDDINDNVSKVLYDIVNMDVYEAYFNSDSNAPHKYFATLEEAENYCSTEPYTLITDSEGNPVISNKEYKLYKYRDKTSGIYIDSFNADATNTISVGNKYLYDYLENFSAYIPKEKRSYETFKHFSSSASSSSLYKSAATNGSIQGNAERNPSQQEYIEFLVPYAQAEMRECGILASVTIAQAIQETATSRGWGTSSLRGPDVNNYFGMKAGSKWDGRVYNVNTGEYTASGSYYTENANFRAYDSIEEGFHNRSQLIYNRYSAMIGNQSYRESCQILKDCGWATDPRYVDSLVALIENYGLDQYDTETWTGQMPDYIDISGGSSTSAFTSSVSTSYRMNPEDAEMFYMFYHQFDDMYDGSHKLEEYNKHLSEEEINDMLKLTNTYIDGSTLRQEDMYYNARLMDENYITNLSKNSNQLFSGTISGLSIADVSEIADYDFLWPVAIDENADSRGNGMYVTSNFGARWGSTHQGTDVSCVTGTFIVAVSDGIVSQSYSSSSAGEYIVIDHGLDGSGRAIKTEYMHNSERLVNEGEEVKRGQVIARSGNTGISTGPHLHFGLRINEQRIDSLIPYRPDEVKAINKNGIEITFMPQGLYDVNAVN